LSLGVTAVHLLLSNFFGLIWFTEYSSPKLINFEL
jgi:hypothetical protein